MVSSNLSADGGLNFVEFQIVFVNANFILEYEIFISI